MFATALIVFREVLEAALIISIVLAATSGVRNRAFWISSGALAGLLGAIIVAFFADVIASALSGIGQEVFNAGVLFTAVIMLGWHNVWMKQHGRELASHFNRMGKGVVEGEQSLYVLAVVVGLAVLREGSEVVLFLYGIATSGEAGSMAMLSGGGIGILLGGVLGLGMYFGLLRIPTRHLFSITSWLILLLAAGMASQGAAFLVQANILPSLGQSIWNTSSILSERSMLGQFLHMLVGYSANPSGIQIIFYLATLLLIGGSMKLVGRPGAVSTKKIQGVAAVFIAFGLTAALTVVPGPAHATQKVYSPYVEKGEFEFEIRSHIDRDSDTNKNNKRKDKYEIGYGFTDWWFSSVFLEYEREPGQKLKKEATAWENIFQLTEPGKYWLDAGLYIEYEKPSDTTKPDKLEIKALLEKNINRFAHTLNLKFERQVGNGASSDIELGYAWRTKYRYKPTLEFSLEAYGDLGDLDNVKINGSQQHQLGPVLSGKFKIGQKSKIMYELGYLYGLTSSSPNGSVKWLLEYETRF